ncbi:MAG: hypothetical protein N2255_00140 [Kiritimatiellae bacterium]|nr:hypothetical protein [Kiritimatiellia bacterium]
MTGENKDARNQSAEGTVHNEEDIVVLSVTGEPFSSEEAAKNYLRATALDASRYKAVPYKDGWALVDSVRAAVMVASQDAGGRTEQRIQTKYRWVRFHRRTDLNDEEVVELHLNGQTLQVDRMVKVPLPQHYLDGPAARAGKYHYRQFSPSSFRAERQWVAKYTWDDLGEATEQDFLDALERGLVRRGMTAVPFTGKIGAGVSA